MNNKSLYLMWAGILLILIIMSYLAAFGVVNKFIMNIEGMFDNDKYIQRNLDINKVESSGISQEVEEGSPYDSITNTEDDAIAFSSVDKIKEYIRKQAEMYGVDPELALAIANCESNFRNICNEKYGCMAGIGIYQIVQSTFDEAVQKMENTFRLFCESDGEVKIDKRFKHDKDGNPIILSPYNIQDNIDIAIWLISKGETWRWSASSHCWSNKIN